MKPIQKNSSKQQESNNDDNVCPKCKGTGWMPVHPGDWSLVRECDCVRIKKMKNIIERSGVSKAFQNLNFNSYKPITQTQEKMKQTAISYIMNFEKMGKTRHNSIAFLGQCGSGKTHLSIAIANTLMNKGIPVMYMPYRESITMLNQYVYYDEKLYQNKMDQYKNVNVLLIDDLFKGKATEADLKRMFEIINYRYLNMTPVIISSECNPTGLMSFDEAIGSRIIEMCENFTVEVIGEENNYRLRHEGKQLKLNL